MDERGDLKESELVKTLEEIELFFAACYMNAQAGGAAQKKYNRYMVAADTAKCLIGKMQLQETPKEG